MTRLAGPAWLAALARLAAIAVALWLIAATATAQQDGAGAPTDIDRLTEALAGAAPPDPDAPAPAIAFPDLPEGYVPSDRTLASVDAAVNVYYEHRADQFRHRLSVFRWQYVSSVLIFVVVVLIVAVGLYFSWMQFHAARTGKDVVGVTTIEAGKTGFKLSSPVLGVIILALSLAFFYLYLVHVYPISEIG